MTLDLIFGLGTVTFAVSSLFFLLTKPKDKFPSALIVSLITLVSYLVMWDGRFTLYAQVDEPVNYTRWLFYIFSCTVLIYVISEKLGFKMKDRIENVYYIAIVMATGALASVSFTWVAQIIFVVGGLVFLYLVERIIKLESKAKSANTIKLYVAIGWMAFPVVFLLSSLGFGLLEMVFIQALYLFLDIMTKIVFYFSIEAE